MENNNFNENNLLEKENIFIHDYFNQKIQNNNKFKIWENLMLKKYGNNARLFKCIVDKIYFYISNEDCMEYPYYSSHFPICNNVICYYCLRNSAYSRMEFLNVVLEEDYIIYFILEVKNILIQLDLLKIMQVNLKIV